MIPGMTEERMEECYRQAAKLAVEDPAFIPVFERMEEIKADFEAEQAALERARAALGAAR